MYNIGKTVVVGQLLDVNDVSAKFLINGKEYDIEAIPDNGDFLSPLNRKDESSTTRTMSEYLMHPKKSRKRKLKIGDYALLVLQKFVQDSKLIYKLQNAHTFIRKLNVRDDMEYKGFILHRDDVVQYVKDNHTGLPTFLIKISSLKRDREKVIESIKTLLDNNIVNYVVLNYKENDEYVKKSISLEKNEEYENSISFEEFLKMEIEEYTISVFLNATKQHEVTEKYKKVFLNNAITKRIKTELDSHMNQDVSAFFSPKEEQLENSEKFSSKIIYGREVGEYYLYAPSILSLKQSYDKDENSFYVISRIIPDIIEIRKRSKEYLKNQLEKEE